MLDDIRNISRFNFIEAREEPYTDYYIWRDAKDLDPSKYLYLAAKDTCLPMTQIIIIIQIW